MANLTGKKISETELTNTIENNDLIPLIQEGINKIIEFSDVLKQIAQQIITNNEDDSSTDKAASAKLLNDLSASLNNINNNLVSRIDDIETNIDNINNRDIRSDWNETNSSSVKYIQNKPISLQGKSAYQVAVENGFVGTEDQWLVSLKGAKGDTGAKGDPGFNGTSTYFHVRYSVNSNGNPIQSTPAKYIGTVVTNSSLPPTNYTQYTWYDWEGAQGPNGEQGIPGVNGSNGQTSYLHIKYSDNGGLTFTSSNGETPGDWLGQYVDFNLIDSLNVNDYTWSKIKGLNGIDGKSTEFIFTTTNTSTSPAQPTTSQVDDYVPTGWTDDPTGVTQAKPYEWVCQRTKTNGIWSQFSTPAIWAKFGLDGSKGDAADWVSFVFKQSTTQPTTPTGTAVIPSGWVDAPSNTGTWWMSKSTISGTTGLAGTWSTPAKVTGIDGATGATGPSGSNGTDGSYVIYQFSKNTSTTIAPTTGWSSTPPTLSNGEYCWMRYGTVIPPATTPASWSSAVRISGEKGNTGDTGPMGSSGPMLLARGLYSSSETYTGSSTIRQAVKWNNGTQDFWYLTLPTAGQFSNIPPSNSLYWEPFTQNIDWVATKLLLAEGANIAGWVFHVNGSGNQMLQSQNGSTTLNGTTGDITATGTFSTKVSSNYRIDLYDAKMDIYSLDSNQSVGNVWGTIYGVPINSGGTIDYSPTATYYSRWGTSANSTLNGTSFSGYGSATRKIYIDWSPARTGSYRNYLIVILKDLPTTNPSVAGQLWNDSGTLKISS